MWHLLSAVLEACAARAHCLCFCQALYASLLQILVRVCIFSPLQFYRCQQWMRGLPDQVLHVWMAFLKPALLPLFLNKVHSTGSFILVLVSWNCLSALGYQNRECSFHKTVRVPASQYVNSHLIPRSSELRIREVFGYSLISSSPVSVSRQGKRQKIWFPVAGVFCLRTTTFLRCMIQQVCRSTLGLSSYRVKS